MRHWIITCLVVLFFAGCSGETEKTLIKKGDVVRVEYLQRSWGSVAKTILYFDDCSTMVLSFNYYNVPANPVSVYQYSNEWNTWYKLVSD